MIDHDEFMRVLFEELETFVGQKHDEVGVKQMEQAATYFIQSFEPSVKLVSFDKSDGTAQFSLGWTRKE